MLILSSICRKRIEPSQSLTLWNGSNRRHIITMPTTAKPIPQLTPQQQVNFWKKVDRNGPTMPHMDTPCWVWTAGKDKDGYGKFGVGGYRAHRISFVLSGGSLGGEKNFACHRCDNPSCCNPSHIWAGTSSENASDRESKGRGNQPVGESHYTYIHPELRQRGEAHGRAKLTTEQVIEIRNRYSKGDVTQRKLATEYGVRFQSISKIILREKWTHI